jgi:hypothetical protein
VAKISKNLFVTIARRFRGAIANRISRDNVAPRLIGLHLLAHHRQAGGLPDHRLADHRKVTASFAGLAFVRTAQIGKPPTWWQAAIDAIQQLLAGRDR